MTAMPLVLRALELVATLPARLAAAAASTSSGYGGQALVEGILMRGPAHVGVALRAPDGAIVVAAEPVAAHPLARRVARVPLLRGMLVLYETIALGGRWLMRSSEIAAGEEEASGSTRATGIALVGATIAVSLAIFTIAPALLAALAVRAAGIDALLVERLLDGVIQAAIFLAYVALVGRSPSIDRTYRYHGAEHRAIHAYEHGEPLTRAALAGHPTAHPRCGTEFLVVIIAVSVIAFSLLGSLDPLGVVVSRLAGIPLLAGVAYELLRLLARHRGNTLARALAAPGLAVQGITTRTPDEAMHDVAIAALRVTLEAGGAPVPAGSDRPATRPIAA